MILYYTILYYIILYYINSYHIIAYYVMYRRDRAGHQARRRERPQGVHRDRLRRRGPRNTRARPPRRHGVKSLPWGGRPRARPGVCHSAPPFLREEHLGTWDPAAGAGTPRRARLAPPRAGSSAGPMSRPARRVSRTPPARSAQETMPQAPRPRRHRRPSPPKRGPAPGAWVSWGHAIQGHLFM